MLKIILALVLFFFGSNVFAAKKSKNSDEMNQKSQEILSEINASLAKISEMKVGFRQVLSSKNDSGKAGSGKVEKNKVETGYAQFKNGHGIFIKYESMPVTLLTNPDITVYYDRKMNQKSELPTKNSATKIFTNMLQINEDMFNIYSVKDEGEAYSVVVTVKRMKAEGLITMYFAKSDMLIRRIDIQSPSGDVMRVDIYSHSFETVSPERFKAINIDKNNLES